MNDHDNGIGEYYASKDRKCRAAHSIWVQSIEAYQADPSPKNLRAKEDAYEAMIDAGDTGD